MELSDPALRKGAIGKFLRSQNLARELEAEMGAWWAPTPISLTLDLHSDQQTVELAAVCNDLPPLDDWYHKAADIVQNYRDSLNRLANAVCYLYSAPKKPSDGSFPIRSQESYWQEWLAANQPLPDVVAERFYAFQPFVSGRPFLAYLTKLNNLEKHDQGFDFSVSLSELSVGPGLITVERGEVTDTDLTKSVPFTAGTLDLAATRQVIGSFRLPARVVDLGQTSGSFTFSPMMRYGTTEIPLTAAVSGIGREVVWAISYVTGLLDNAVDAPDHFDLD